jgi:hypothetical protein
VAPSSSTTNAATLPEATSTTVAGPPGQPGARAQTTTSIDLGAVEC